MRVRTGTLSMVPSGVRCRVWALGFRFYCFLLLGLSLGLWGLGFAGLSHVKYHSNLNFHYHDYGD